MEIEFQGSVVFVQDITTSRQFYEGLLGQEVEMDFGLNLGFKGGFALWQVDHAYQMIYETALADEITQGCQNFELYFETPNLESVSTRLSEANVQFIHPLREQPWGQRAFRVSDPDGHIVEVAEPMPVVIVRLVNQGMSVDSVAERTAMTVDIVKQIVVAHDPTAQ